MIQLNTMLDDEEDAAAEHTISPSTWVAVERIVRKINWGLVSALVAVFFVSIYGTMYWNVDTQVNRVVLRCGLDINLCTPEQLEACRDEVVHVHSFAPSLVGDDGENVDFTMLVSDLKHCFMDNRVVALGVSAIQLLQLVVITAGVWFGCFMLVHVVVTLCFPGDVHASNKRRVNVGIQKKLVPVECV